MVQRTLLELRMLRHSIDRGPKDPDRLTLRIHWWLRPQSLKRLLHYPTISTVKYQGVRIRNQKRVPRQLTCSKCRGDSLAKWQAKRYVRKLAAPSLHLLVNTFPLWRSFLLRSYCNSLCIPYTLSLPLLKSHTALCRFYFPLFGNDDLSWRFTLLIPPFMTCWLWSSISSFLYIAISSSSGHLALCLVFTFSPWGQAFVHSSDFKSFYEYHEFLLSCPDYVFNWVTNVVSRRERSQA